MAMWETASGLALPFASKKPPRPKLSRKDQIRVPVQLTGSRTARAPVSGR
jgi:hypothetical protein